MKKSKSFLLTIPDKKTRPVEKKLENGTVTFPARIQKLENKLNGKIHKGDSFPASNFLISLINKYEELKNRRGQFISMDAVYSGYLDSLTTAPGFLNAWLTDDKGARGLLNNYRDVQMEFNCTG